MTNVNNTTHIDICKTRDSEIEAIICRVHEALVEKGYDPINQLVGYILSEDPTYITTHKNARSMLSRVDRYDLLQSLVQNYITK